jgi:hypothetical protein
MDDFDFIKAFADVDILQVEAVGEVVGRTAAAVFKGMIAAGLSHEEAFKIIQMAMRALFASLAPRGTSS